MIFLRGKIITLTSLFLIGSIALGACGDSQTSQVSGESAGIQSNVSAQNVPQFSGPWAAEFAQWYQDTDSELAKKVLATGVITEADLAEAQEGNKVCLEALGFTNVEHYSGGGMSMINPAGLDDEDAQEQVKQCSDESGLSPIETLYATMKVNPNNEDMDTLVVQCLKDAGAVEQAFTVEDLDSWYKNEDPRLLGASVEALCASDPLGLEGK